MGLKPAIELKVGDRVKIKNEFQRIIAIFDAPSHNLESPGLILKFENDDTRRCHDRTSFN